VKGIHELRVAVASVLPVNQVPVYPIAEKTGDHD
jgi:hypothetical protein